MISKILGICLTVLVSLNAVANNASLLFSCNSEVADLAIEHVSVEIDEINARRWEEIIDKTPAYSEAARLGFRIITSPNTSNKILETPSVKKLNRIYNLNESTFHFEEYSGNGLIPKDVYDGALSHNVVLISKYDGSGLSSIFYHDISTHVAGYKILSQTKAWPSVIAAMLDATNKINDPKGTLQREARIERDRFGHMLDSTSNELTRLDRGGQRGDLYDRRAGVNHMLKTAVTNYWEWMQRLKSI